VGTEPRYFLGDEHPFGEMMSALSVRFGKNQESMFILLGPQRMDYKHNWGLFTSALELL
jgi:transcriptional regulator of heat shock response